MTMTHRVSVAAVLITLTVPCSAMAAAPIATTARSLSVKDEGYLSFVKTSGSSLIDEGPVHGTILGKARVNFVYDGHPTVSAQLTIYGHSGSIRVRASGRLSSLTSPHPSFAGTLTVTGGSGLYRHARGSGRLYGVFYRRSYAMTVQTRGTVSY